MPNELVTQLSAKYAPENTHVFEMKERLERLGVRCEFPRSPQVIAYEQGFAITVDEERYRPFYRTEVDFLRAIRQNPLQIVLNTRIDELGIEHPGYVGESTSIETAYALVTNKPIVMIREPFFSEKVPAQIQKLISGHLKDIRIMGIDVLSDDDLYRFLQELATLKPTYRTTPEDADMVMREVLKLARTYRYAWKKYNNQLNAYCQSDGFCP